MLLRRRLETSVATTGACYWLRTGKLLDALQCTGQAPAARNYPAISRAQTALGTLRKQKPGPKGAQGEHLPNRAGQHFPPPSAHTPGGKSVSARWAYREHPHRGAREKGGQSMAKRELAQGNSNLCPNNEVFVPLSFPLISKVAPSRGGP